MEPSRIQTVLSKEQFKEFYTYLNIIKVDVIDLCVVNGQFRSRTYCKTSVIDTFFEYFKDMDFVIGNISFLVRILSSLSKKTKITVTVDDENVYFADGYQNITIERVPSKYCDNLFVTENELNDIILKKIDSNKPLIKYTLPKSLVCNINKMAADIGVAKIKFAHSDDNLSKGCIVISSVQGSFAVSDSEFGLQKLFPHPQDHYRWQNG